MGHRRRDALVGPYGLEHGLMFVPLARLLELLPGIAKPRLGTLRLHRDEPNACLVRCVDSAIQLLVTVIPKAVPKHHGIHERTLSCGMQERDDIPAMARKTKEADLLLALELFRGLDELLVIQWGYRIEPVQEVEIDAVGLQRRQAEGDVLFQSSRGPLRRFGGEPNVVARLEFDQGRARIS